MLTETHARSSPQRGCEGAVAMGTGEGNCCVLETLLQGMRGKSVRGCVRRRAMGGEKTFGESYSWTNDENFHF